MLSITFIGIVVLPKQLLLSGFRGFCTEPPSGDNTEPHSEPSVVVDRLEVLHLHMFGIQVNLNNLGHANSVNWDQQARKKEFSRHRNFRSIKNRFPGV